MAITVGKGPGAKTTPKRRSLSERRAISNLNRDREEEGKEKLKGTEDVPSAPGVSQQDKFAAAQKTVRELNESAQRSGSNNFYALQENSRGEIQIVKRQQTLRNESTGVNKGGVQQIPGLQTQTSSQPKVEERFVPVASSRDGTILLDTEKKEVVREVASFAEPNTLLSSQSQGSVLLSPVESKPKTSALELPGAKSLYGEGQVTPGFVLSEDRRRDIIRFGESLQEKGKSKDNALGFTQRVVGSNLEKFGYAPKSYVAGNIVLPASGGAAITGVAAPVIARAPAVVQGVVASGTVVATGKAVAARPAEAQTPDVLFGLAGSVAGAKAGAFNPNPKSSSVFYANPVPGAPRSPNRAVRLGKATANKPTSKVELRKQTFRQSYDPNLYRVGREYGVKVGKEREFVRFVERGSAEIGQRRPATELGVKGQSYETGVKISPGKAAEPYSRYGFTPSGKDYTLPTSAGQGKQAKYSGRDLSELGYQDTVVALKQNQVSKAIQVFSGPKREPVNVRQPSFVNEQRLISQQKPDYELTPNVKPQEYSQYAGEVSSGRGRGGRVYQSIYSRLNAQRKDFVLVDTPPSSQGSLVARAPIKDVSLNQRFSDVPSIGTQATGTTIFSAGSVPGVLSDAGVKPVANTFSGVRQDFRITPVFAQDSERQQVTAPALSVIRQEEKAVTPVVFQNQGVSDFTVISPKVTQRFRSATDSELVQSNKVVQESVSATKFDFVAPPVPNAPSAPILEKPLAQPVPPTAPTRFKPQPINPRPFRYGEQQRPTPPLRFGLGSSKRGEALYDVQVGSKGNKYFFDLGRGGPEVLTKARDLARGTAAASIRVTPLTRDASSRVDSLIGSDFVRNKSGVYVQKNALRISSAGEKAQIPGASKSRRLTKGEDYGRALKAVRSGFSLRGFRRGG